MPAVAVIGGIASVAGGVTAMAAATSTLATITAGAMIVGGAMTAIGGLTGNKDLMKIGGIVSLAGGVGSLASGLFSETGVASGAASSSGATVDQAATAAGANLADATGAELAGNAVEGTAATTASGTAGAVGGSNVALDLATSPSLSAMGISAPQSIGQQIAGISSNALAGAGSTTGVLGSLSSGLAKLSKYDKLIDIGGGIADYYAKMDEIKATQKVYDDKMNFEKQIYADQKANVNAPFTVNVRARPNSSGILYQGVTPQPIQARKVTV